MIGYRPQHAKRRKREFSKMIFIGVSIVSFAIVVFSCVMIWRTNDLTPLAYLIPAVSAEMATATGFYYSKAKAENQIKLQKLYGQDPPKDAGETNYFGNY